MGDGFVLMRLDSLDSLPDVPSLDTVTPVTSVSAGESTSRPHIVLGWSRSIERSRADFVRLHREVGDEMGQDPEVFDSTFGCDIDRLAKRMAFLYATAGDQATSQVEPEPELLAVGTCTAWEVGGTGWIHSLVVGADHQGRGLSQVLLGAALHRLRDLGHSSAMLAVRPTSHRAISLYQRWGFTAVLEDQDDRLQWASACATAAIDRVTTLPLLPHATEYCARVQHLIREPHSLGSYNSHFALCGPAAVLYSALVQSGQAAVIALLQRLFSWPDAALQFRGGAQIREQQSGTSALVQRYRDQMTAKEVATERTPPTSMDYCDAELDFILCRGLIGLMEDAEPELFAEQARYLATEFPPEHGFDVEHGDLALLPDGMHGLLRALHTKRGIDGSARWRTVPQESLCTAEAVLSELRAAAAVPDTVALAGRVGAEGQPSLDHWFVVHDFDLPSAADALGGVVWNYAGHAGSPFKVTSSSGDASAWFELGFHTLIIVSPE